MMTMIKDDHQDHDDQHLDDYDDDDHDDDDLYEENIADEMSTADLCWITTKPALTRRIARTGLSK